MGKIISVFFMIMFFTIIVGCGSQNTDDTETIRSLSVTINDTMITPYENFVSKQIYTENGWIAGDGMSATYILPDIAGELQEIKLDNSLSFKASGNGQIQGFDIFDEEFTRIYHQISEEELHKLDEGVYYVSVLVKWSGKYIPSGNNYETFCNEYMFKMRVGKKLQTNLIIKNSCHNGAILCSRH